MKRLIYTLLCVAVVVGILVTGYLLWAKPRVAQVPPQPFSLLVLGDSIAQGVGSVDNDNSLSTYIAEDLGPFSVDLTLENKAVSGSKTDEVLNDQLTKLFKDHYSAALLIVGTNDITHLVSPSKFESNYAEIVRVLSGKADIVVLANIPQFSNTPIVPDSIQTVADYRTKSYNNKIDNIANNYSNVRIFNFYAFSQNRLRGETNYIATDGFHPNDEGYKLISQELSRIILEK